MDVPEGQVYCPISEVRSLKPAEGGRLGEEETGSLARQTCTAAAFPFSATAGCCLPPAAPTLTPLAGWNTPCWPGSTLGCEVWLSWHLGEWGSCHPGACGLGWGQWADEGMVGEPESQELAEAGQLAGVGQERT